MKQSKPLVSSLLSILFSLLLTIGVKTFMGPCVHEDGTLGNCHWAGEALAGLGAVMCVQNVIAFILRDSKTRLGAYLSILPVSLLSLLVPGTVIAICKMNTMRCVNTMRPATMILSALILLFSGINAYLEWKRRV